MAVMTMGRRLPAGMRGSRPVTHAGVFVQHGYVVTRAYAAAGDSPHRVQWYAVQVETPTGEVTGDAQHFWPGSASWGVAVDGARRMAAALIAGGW